MTAPQILWLRRDLRLADQPAFYAAAQAGPVIPIFVYDEKRGGDHAYGAAQKVWLHLSLSSLAKSLEERGSRLVIRRGDAAQIIAELTQQTGANAVHAIAHYEPWWKKAEDDLCGALDPAVEMHLYDGNYLMPPGTLTTGSGKPYKIYSPFAKAMLEQTPPRDPVPEPDSIKAPETWPESDDIADWLLMPTKPDWASQIREHWTAGEAAAHDRLEWWAGQLTDYDVQRNHPSQDMTSQLSPHLHWGEISPAQIWHRLHDKRSDGWRVYAKEIIWRDYTQNIIHQFPDYARKSYRDYDEAKLWRNPDKDAEARADLTAWQKGETGYPIVDAGMRQLWQIGWIHNRVRMICASFLTKHLIIDWRHGEQWYWDCLVDADYGNNGVNWQWIAGTGVDANMFSRIMAPLTQSEKYKAGDYIRTWVPELASLGDDVIHDPPDDRRADYPPKMIGHREARERALERYRRAKA